MQNNALKKINSISYANKSYITSVKGKGLEPSYLCDMQKCDKAVKGQ